METERTYTAFAGERLIAGGDLKTVLLGTKEYLDCGGADPVLIFEDQTGRQIDFDFRGTPEEVLARIPSHPFFAPAQCQEDTKRGPGRPKLGVVSREISLLPRHWEWLGRQRGGASAALRRLIDEKRKGGESKERARPAWEAAGKFMWAIAGNLPDFEEASRALYAKDRNRLTVLIRDWPEDIRNHIERLTAEAARLESGSNLLYSVEEE
jgi:hypothetical protein